MATLQDHRLEKDGEVNFSVHEQDSRDMDRMGKKQELTRNFRVVSISCFTCAAMMGFVFIPISCSYLIASAGTAGAIVTYICNFFGFLMLVLSLAEMSSIAPTAGGQYHWTSEFCPPSIQGFVSYISGWLSSLSWLCGVSSAMYLIGNLIPQIASLENPNYTPEFWQAYLVIVLTASLVYTVNALLGRYLPTVEIFVIGFMAMAFITLITVLLAMSPKLSNAEVWSSFGAPGMGRTSVLESIGGQVSIFYSLLGSDATAHMAEETRHAHIVIPRAMVASYIIMGAANFVVLIVYCYCWTDPDAFLENAYPFLGVFVSATGSTTGAAALASIMLVLIMLSVTNFFASTSRQIFAFARDDGLPGRTWFAKVNRRTGMPVNSMAMVFGFVVLITLIGLGSEVAFNAIISLQAMAMCGTYEISICSLIWRRLYGKPLPDAPWSLGRAGLLVNMLGALYGLYALVYSAMPSTYPITPVTLNWAPVMIGAIGVLALVYYFVWARKVYKGPAVKCADW